jgi:hypothetical protein
MAGSDLPELGAEGDLGGVIKRLVAEEDDFPRVQCLTDGLYFAGG